MTRRDQRLPTLIALLLGCAAGAGRADACQVWNQTGLMLWGDKGLDLIFPYDVDDALPGSYGLRLKADGEYSATAGVGGFLKCKRGQTLAVRIEGGDVVTRVLPKSIVVEVDRHENLIRIKGPAKKLKVTIDGVEVASDARGRVTHKVVVGKDAMLDTPVNRDPRLLSQGYRPVHIEAERGKDWVDLYWSVRDWTSLGPIAKELAAVKTTPVSWAPAAAAAAPHPGVFVRGTGGAMIAVNGLARLRDVQIVAVAEVALETVEECRYGTFIKRRIRDVATVTVYEAHSGRELGSKPFRGGDPAGCPHMIDANKADARLDLVGSSIDPEVIAWMKQL